MKNFKMDIELKSTTNIQEAQLISRLIAEENKINGEHMIFNSPEVIQKHINKYGGFILKTLGDFIGAIKLEKVEDNGLYLYEKGGLIIRNEYRELGFASFLQKTLHHFHNDKPIYSVTNVDRVKYMNQKLGNLEIQRDKIKKEILDLIEKPAKLLDSDVVFFNKTAIELYNL